ncbi:MAG: sugar ABC transporter ATP-binding protein [Gemmataceae bacterium]|nr:sugar ABC transporter ATP-binding protein [Gemmataceae bacterium]
MPGDPPATAPLLEMKGIKKSFPGAQALQGVDLHLHQGEILGLIGENGAGKSTLIKILGGAVHPDAGEIRLRGKLLGQIHPALARAEGIAVIHQEFALVSSLSARENIFLGNPPGNGFLIRRGEERRRARDLLDKLGARFSEETLCGKLSVAQQQLVEIAKALSDKARLLVLDEPTAALTPRETEALFALVRQLRSEGIGVIYISHRLEEIFALADRIQVLRDGKEVAQAPARNASRAQVIQWMVGRNVEVARSATAGPARGEILLEARGLNSQGKVRDVSLAIHAGEIVVLTGLVGSGRTETARLLFGAERPDSGEILVQGKKAAFHSVRGAIACGICMLSEDRKGQGLIPRRSLVENYSLASLGRFSNAGWMQAGRERQSFLEKQTALGIKAASPQAHIRALSGGNQQKVLLARWLATQGQVFILDEPTRGVDVGAKVEIHDLLRSLAREGKGVLVISSELPEVLALADRILVMHEGRVTGEISDPAAATQERIMELAVR